MTHSTEAGAIARWRGAWISTLRIGWRADASVAVLAFALVLAVTAGMVAAERAVDGAEADSLDHALRSAPVENTRLRIGVSDLFTPTSGTDPLAAPRRTVDAAAATIDPLVMSLYDDPRLVVDTPTFTAVAVDGAPPGSPTTLVLRIQEGLDDHSTISTGRPPGEADDVDGVEAIEVVVSTETAGIMQWNVGTSILVGATPDDPLFRGFDNLPDEFLVNVAGVAELDDVGDAYWSGDPRLHRPIVDDTGVGANFTVFATIDEAQLPMLLSMLGGQSALRVEQRWDLDPSRIDMNNVDDVSTAVRATQATTSETAPFGSPAVTIELGEVLDLEAARRAATHDAIRIASIGVAAAAIATFVLLQQMGADRRREWWTQARSRGVSAVAMAMAATATTALAAALGIVAGASIGTLLVGGSSADLPIALIAAFGAALVATDAVLQSIEARRALQPAAVAGSSRWTRAAAILVVVIAVASTVTLRRRGVSVGAGIDIVVLLPVVFVPLATSVVVVAVMTSALRGRTVGGLGIGVGRLVGLRRALELRGSPSVVFAVTLCMSTSITSAAIVGSFDAPLDGPLAATSRRAFVAAGATTWLLALGGVAVAALVTMRRRRSDAGLLAALGADRREFGRAVRAELVPMVVVGIITGAVAATVLVATLEQRLDLTAQAGLATPSTAARVGGTFIVMASLFAATLGIVRLAVARTRSAPRGGRP